MRKTYRLVFITLTFALTLVLMSAMVFADEATTYPNASFTITDKDNKSIDLQFDYMTKTFKNFPQEGDKVSIFYNGNTSGSPNEVFTYSKSTGRFEGSANTWFRWNIYDSDYGNRSVTLKVRRKLDDYAYDSDLYYDIRKSVKVTAYRAPLKSLSYKPSSFRVYSENVKVTSNNGTYFYSFCNRASHSAGSKKWKSAFAVGDTITATFEDGKTINYVNKDVLGDGGYDDYFVNGDEIFIGLLEEHKLNRGNNKLYVYLYISSEQTPSVKAPIDVYLWTPDMGTYPGDYAEEQPLADGKSASEKQTEKQKAPAVTAGEKTVKPVSVVKIKNVSAGRTGKKLTVTWKALSKTQKAKVSRIQVQYSKNRQFKNAKKVWVKKNQKKYTTKKLKKGNYYVRVRSMRKIKDKKYYSKWSAVKNVKIR